MQQDRFLERLELPIKAASTIVSAASLVATIWASAAKMFVSKPNVGLILGIGSALLFLFSTTFLIVALRRRNVMLVRDCTDLSGVDKNLGIGPTLQNLEKHPGTLIVLGRTCYRWFTESEAARENGTSNELGLIEKAAFRGARLSFYVMSPSKIADLDDIAIDPKKRRQLRDELKEVERIFSRAKERLRNLATREVDPSQNLNLSFMSRRVSNSKSLLKTERKRPFRFVYEIGTDFALKPAIVFLGKSTNQADAAFQKVLQGDLEVLDQDRGCTSFDDVNSSREQGKKEVATLIREYPHKPELRKNSSLLLARTYVGHFRHVRYPALFPRIPPVTVQLHLTNQCTTKCKMCRHYLIGRHKVAGVGDRESDELSGAELRLVVRAIDKLGTRTLIVSGGEPLSRPTELFQVLDEASTRKLETGLLTNGIKPNLSPVSLDECKSILAQCKWVQLSIDSFDPKTYKTIRGVDGLAVVLETLRNLLQVVRERGWLPKEHLEICYTIQRDNVKEVPSAEAMLKGHGLPDCWDLVRFKYAHGPERERPAEAKPFLCRVEDLTGLKRAMAGSQRLAYLFNRYQKMDELAAGKPTASMTGGRCLALNLTCTIDAFGNVYPCCFLFDDNSDRDSVRSRYKLGSLRQEGGVGDKCESLLQEAWTGSRLDELRGRELMVDKDACCYCTRHYYNNEFLNKLQPKLEEYCQHFDLEALEEDILPPAPDPDVAYWL